MTEKIAIIDMGTNTFHLLIAERSESGKYDVIYRDRVAVKIGKDGINRGYITDAGISRAVQAVQDFKAIIDRHHTRNVQAFGTSAIRSASNSAEVVQKIKDVTGIDTTVISGDTEAEFIYEGVNYALEMGNKKSLIVDIGGGSVEFIIGNQHKIFWKQSVEIGAQRLLERFQNHDPIAQGEIQLLDEHFKRELGGLSEALAEHSTETLIGASGTFDTLSDIFCLQHGISKSDYAPETPLTVEAFYEIYQQLISKNRGERMQMPGMIEMRVDMIVVACCLVRFILSLHAFKNVRVSSYSLKEGVLACYVKKLKSTKLLHKQ